MKRVAFILIIIFSTAVFFISCGGGSSNESDYTPYNAAWIRITNPDTDPYTADTETLYVSGEAFISPDWSHCCSGSAEDTAVTVTWQNVTTGASGQASQHVSYCWFFIYYLCNHTWSADIPLAMGTNKIVVTASDPEYSNTDTITIIREPDTTSPTVISTSPTDDSVDIAVNVPVLVTFSETMDVTTINTDTVVLDSNTGHVTGSVTYSSRTAIFTPSEVLTYGTHYTGHVGTGVKDIAGNALAEEYEWSFTTGSTYDTEAPSVISVDPENGTECTLINSRIEAIFSEELYPSTVNNGTFILTNLDTAAPHPGLVEYSDLKAIFHPYTNLEFEASYMASVTDGITDLAGNHMISNYSWTFKTASGTNGIWSTTSTTNAPSARFSHTAVWSGTEMIIWGGSGDSIGGIYNPLTDSWRSAAVTDYRYGHTAVWTGSEMLVWGGFGYDVTYLDTGGRYNPETAAWHAISQTDAPAPRWGHTGIWTGSEMIIWGGNLEGAVATNTGGRYNPVTDTWQPLPTVGAPDARCCATAVWTGQKMLVFGGSPSSSVEGGRYDPITDSWQPISTDGFQVPLNPVSVWTGSEMLVFGSDGTGGRYNPDTDTWLPISAHCAPDTDGPSAVWTGNSMIIWGGLTDTGASYNPSTDTWSMLPVLNAPSKRHGHTALWTGNEMIIWGGGYDTATDTGGRYAP